LFKSTISIINSYKFFLNISIQSKR